MSKSIFRTMALTNIRGNRRFYVPFLLTIVMTAAMFYSMCSIGKNPVITEHGAVKDTLEFGVYIIGIFAVIFIFYTNSFLMKRRKRELGLYHILGLEKRHITGVLFWETLFLAAVGIGGGLALGILLDRLMFLGILKVFRFSVSVPYQIYPSAVGRTAALFAVIFLLIFFSNVRSVRRVSAIELLKSENAGEREPKTRWVLAVLGAVCTGTGYYMAITVDNVQAALTSLFIAVLLVMVGTYCLFMAGSIAVLKRLKKNRAYYYRTNHFVAVSGLIYRMKQNAVGLANIAILSTGVLLIISTTVCLYAGMDDIIRDRFPTEISLTNSDGTQEEHSAIEQNVQEVSEELGIKVQNYRAYQEINITFLKKENELSAEIDSGAVISMNDVLPVTFITAQTYEELTGEKLTLQGNQVALFHSRDMLSETFRIMGEEYQTAAELETFPVSNKMQNVAPDWMNIVVSNDEVLQRIYLAQKEAYETPSSMVFEVEFDAGGTQEESAAFYHRLEEKLQADSRITNYNSDSRTLARDDLYQLYGGILFLGIYLGTLFLMATVLIIYYKQIIEGYEDQNRYVILKKVGMDKKEVKRSIRSQILILFFLPLGTALLHCLAAFRLMTKILQAFYMNNILLFAGVTAAVAAIFTLVYILVYSITAKSYYHIVNA
ncbi:MAG: FtsX-like permease family protein [Eubacteriales bacterium]|nr:FtsX-like permease family protein [Eubacteriales bacterium]